MILNETKEDALHYAGLTYLPKVWNGTDSIIKGIALLDSVFCKHYGIVSMDKDGNIVPIKTFSSLRIVGVVEVYPYSTINTPEEEARKKSNAILLMESKKINAEKKEPSLKTVEGCKEWLKNNGVPSSSNVLVYLQKLVKVEQEKQIKAIHAERKKTAKTKR